MRPTAKPGMVSPSRVRHVGLAVFAVILCRKFAAVAAFSWHLPALQGCRRAQSQGTSQMLQDERREA
jgi:hypothetical protein